jgi:hypothetical protein
MRYKVSEQEVESAKAVASQLRAGLAGLAEAEQTMRTANGKFEQLALANLAAFNTLRPDDDAALDSCAAKKARFTVLREWIASAEPLRDAVRELQASLWRARDVVQEIGQARSIDEGSITPCFWAELLRRVPDIDLPNQIQTVRSIGNQVVRDLDQLLSCRVGLLLGDDERRDGVLRISGRGVVRQLAANERSAGVAFE